MTPSFCRIATRSINTSIAKNVCYKRLEPHELASRPSMTHGSETDCMWQVKSNCTRRRNANNIMMIANLRGPPTHFLHFVALFGPRCFWTLGNLSAPTFWARPNQGEFWPLTILQSSASAAPCEVHARENGNIFIRHEFSSAAKVVA